MGSKAKTSHRIPVTCDPEGRLRRVPLADLKRFQGNMKVLREPQYKKLHQSIESKGFCAPIFLWAGHDSILDGHQRLNVVEREVNLGHWQIEGEGLPVVDIEAADEQDAAEKLLLLSSTYGKIDPQGLYEFTEQHQIPLTEFTLPDLPDFDFDAFKVEYYQDATVQGNGDPDAIPDIPVESVTQPGDLWLLGDHRLLCGDSTKAEDIERLVNGMQVSAVITDPPYGIDLDTDFSSMKSKLSFATKKRFFGGKRYAPVQGDDEPFDPLLFLALCGNIPEQIWFGADYYNSRLCDTEHGGSWFVWDKRVDEQADKMFGSCFELIWSKKKRRREILRYKWAGVFGVEQEIEKKRVHPTQKPTALLIDLLLRTTGKNDVVIDPYAGSGGLLMAAEKKERQCLLMEIIPAYCDVIVRRWQDYTGQSATLDGDGRMFAEIADNRVTSVAT